MMSQKVQRLGFAKDDDPDVVFMKWNGYPRGGEKSRVRPRLGQD
jgi:hypothetical protein